MARVGVDGGDSGKLLGGLVLAGSGRCVGGEFLFFHGRAPTPAKSWLRFYAQTEGKKVRVSAVS